MRPVLLAHDHDVSDLGVVGWVLVGLAAVAVAWVLWRAVVLTVRPGEDDPGHIKRTVLEEEAEDEPATPAEPRG